MTSTTAILLRGLFAAAALIITTGCHKAGSQEAPRKAEAKAKARDPLEISVPSSLREQITVGEPQSAQVVGTLRVAARVEADETRMARVSSPVTGRLTELEVLEGQPVHRGQVLAMVYSTELSSIQFGFLRAYSQQQLGQRAVARAKQLLEAGVIGEAELQRREAELVQTTAEVSSAHDQLNVLGMSRDAIQKLQTARAINSLAQIVSPIDGMVLDRKVTIGQIVQPADTAFVVADLSHVWLVADVPEQAAARLAVGKSVEAEIASLPGNKLRGKVSFVSAIVDAETRTVRTRMDLPNPKLRYKPSMLATMILKDGAEQELVIPPTAVVREGNYDHVFVQTGPDTFTLRRVTLGYEYDEGRVLSGGIQPGEKIVLNGAFHLNNERKRLSMQGGE